MDRRYGETIRDMGRREHASAGRPSVRAWAESPSHYLVAPAARPDALRARIRSCRVARKLPKGEPAGKEAEVRVVGLDIHRVFAAAVMPDGGRIKRLGRVGMTREHLEAFARTLTHDDHVVGEVTGNATAVADIMKPHVARVAIANPLQVRMIAHAKIKTDKIDATVLAKLYASTFWPEVWVPDAQTLALRRQVTRRNQIVQQRVRLKTTTQSILHAH